MASVADKEVWKTARYHTDVVPIANGSRRLWVTVAGQKRPQPIDNATLQPLVIIEAGLGGVAAEHVVVAQLIASFARVLRYDRAGYGASTFEKQPDEISAADRAKDLSLLLEALDLPPPYVLVGHSFGGTLVREFLEQRGSKDVVGMVLVDCLPLIQLRERFQFILGTLCGDGTGAAYGDAIGLRQNVVLTPEQMNDCEATTAVAEDNGTIAAEAKVSDQSQAAINEAEGIQSTADDEGFVTHLKFTKQPLGQGRLSVILGDIPRDFGNLISFAKAHGYGTEAQHVEAGTILERIKATAFSTQEAQCALTAGESRVVKASGTGRTHNLQLTRPDIIAKEVAWVMAGQWELDESIY